MLPARDVLAKWLEKAAVKRYGGDARVQYKLAMMYYEGKGDVRDLPLAKEWMEKAAVQGDARAQYKLAMMYYEGKGVVRDLSLAKEWLEKVAVQGDVRAQYKLAMMYYGGKVLVCDLDLPLQPCTHMHFRWFRGDPRAMFRDIDNPEDKFS